MEVVFFLYKWISFSVFPNINMTNPPNHSFIPHIFVEPDMVAGTGDLVGNRIDSLCLHGIHIFVCVWGWG